jgi:hypothetical protein
LSVWEYVYQRPKKHSKCQGDHDGRFSIHLSIPESLPLHTYLSGRFAADEGTGFPPIVG